MSRVIRQNWAFFLVVVVFGVVFTLLMINSLTAQVIQHMERPTSATDLIMRSYEAETSGRAGAVLAYLGVLGLIGVTIIARLVYIGRKAEMMKQQRLLLKQQGRRESERPALPAPPPLPRISAPFIHQTPPARRLPPGIGGGADSEGWEEV